MPQRALDPLPVPEPQPHARLCRLSDRLYRPRLSNGCAIPTQHAEWLPHRVEFAVRPPITVRQVKESRRSATFAELIPGHQEPFARRGAGPVEVRLLLIGPVGRQSILAAAADLFCEQPR